MAWERLALLQAAGEDEPVLDKMAELFGYAKLFDEKSNQTIYGTLKATLPGISVNVDVATAKRPPARFPRINKIIKLETNREHFDTPAYLYNSAMLLRPEHMPAGSYSFDAPKPLVPMARLAPLLFNSLGQAKAGNGLDHNRLIQRIARGQSLQHLPKAHRQRWPQRLLIIVDASDRLEPYWAYFAEIVSQLQKLLGQEAVEAIRFDDDTLGEEAGYYVRWPTQDCDQWRLWQTPPSDVSILLLSDLGVSDSRAAVRWQRQLEALQTHPAPILTLSPADNSPDDDLLCRCFKPNPLNDNVRLPRHPLCNGFSLPVTSRLHMEDILAWLAPLPLVDAGLLRRFRQDLNWGDSALETAIWNHPNMRHIGLGIRLRDEVVERYRQKYQQQTAGSPEAERYWEIVNEHHATAYQGLKQLETLNRCVLESQDDAAMREYFQKLCATAMQGKPNIALQAQCRTVLASRPQSIWQSEYSDLAYLIFAVAHGEQIRNGKWPEQLEPGFDPTRLEWLIVEPTPWEKVWWQIVQVGDQGQIRCEPICRENAARLPLVQLEISKPFPPRITTQVSGKPITRILQGGETFSLVEDSVAIFESRSLRIELEAIKRPSWASRIWMAKAEKSAAGLWARISWLRKEYDVHWHVTIKDSQGYWAWRDPFGEDQYGLYADLSVNNVTQRFRWIEPGSFMMGSPANEPDQYDNETKHQVTLTQGFWLADTAVTQAFWLAVMGGDNPSHFNDDLQKPVELVSWHDAQQFIEKLNEQIPGLHAQLPTEAQWEYACRAGTSTPFSFGDNICPEQVNYNAEYPYAGGAVGLNRGKTVPVKSLRANSWGLYEMHGNVWEWCADAWREDLGSEAVVDPLNNGEQGGDRVLRGGSWDGGGGDVRSVVRNHYTLDDRGFNLGFRLSLGHAELNPDGGTGKDEILRLGDRGQKVRRLQEQLNAAGATLVLDGVFGPSTQKAVMQLQKQYGMQPDGIYGPRVAMLLRSGQKYKSR